MPNSHRHVSDTARSGNPHAPSAGTQSPGAPGMVVGGYRLVRVVGDGSQATVHLGFADGAANEEPPRTAAVKIHNDGVSLEQIDREIAALTRVEHPHLLNLIDLATLPSGRPCLVFERLGTGSLAQLLAGRSNISAGEAVTLIAPLASAVDELHRGGVVHGRVRASSVLFRESGAPVLIGFGSSTLVASGQPPASLARNELVVADRRALALVASAILERVPGESARLLLEALASDGVESDDFGDLLAERLFELAGPEPVRLSHAGEAVRAVGSAARAPVPVVPIAPRHDGARVRRSLRPTAARLSRRVAALPNVLRGHLGDTLRGVRPRFWAVSAVVAVSLVVALFVVPHSGGDQSQSGETSAETRPTASPTKAPTDPLDPVLGDDPLAAVAALLAERDRCFRDLSVLCLDGVLQPGSAALERDSALVRQIQNGGELTTDAAIVANAPVLVERLGDSALVEFGDVPDTQPASTLMMRGEAGWRIRDYVSE